LKVTYMPLFGGEVEKMRIPAQCYSNSEGTHAFSFHLWGQKRISDQEELLSVVL